MARDLIFVSELRVDCIIGVLAHERVRPQPLRVDVELGLDTAKAGHSGRISATCDYRRVAEELSTLLEFRRYKLLEVAAEELAAMLLGVHPMLDEVRLRLTKPQALRGRARAAGVEVVRHARDRVRTREPSEFGEVEILAQSREAGLYLIHIEPGRELPTHDRPDTRELEWLVDGTIERDGERLRLSSPSVRREDHGHRYANVSGRRATLFRCASPPALPTDVREC